MSRTKMILISFLIIKFQDQRGRRDSVGDDDDRRTKRKRDDDESKEDSKVSQ